MPRRRSDAADAPASGRRFRPGSALGWRRLSRCILAIYLLALLALVCWCSPQAGRWQSYTLQAAPGTGLTEAALQSFVTAAKECLLFLGLAFWTGAALGPAVSPAPLLQVLQRATVALIISFVIASLTRTLLYGAPFAAPSFPAAVMLGIVCWWGSWLGGTWVCARQTVSWAVKQAFLTAFLMAAAGAGFGWMTLASEPLPIQSADLTTEHRRRLFNLVMEKDPRDLQPHETAEVHLTEHDCNLLCTWGLSLLPGDHAINVKLDEDIVRVQMSLQLPVVNRYLNLTTTGGVVVRDRELGFSPRAITLGRLKIPGVLLAMTGPIRVGSEWPQDAIEPLFRSLHRITLRRDGARISYGHLDMKNGSVRKTLVGLGVLDNELDEAARAQVANLVAIADERGRLAFTDCITAAFDLARARTQRGTAVRENRGALLALGCVVGHSKLRMFAGADLPPVSERAKSVLGQVTLRNRRDWARHYAVSAALQVLSNSLASRDAGILKEELDADGGSGFSFADLLADRAGTMLAVRATESEHAAVLMQDLIAAGCLEAHLMPDATGLPEGLSDEMFHRQYGGVGGRGYQRLLGEIDRRINACRAYERR